VGYEPNHRTARRERLVIYKSLNTLWRAVSCVFNIKSHNNNTCANMIVRFSCENSMRL
jgi:hypothetical protein